MVVKNLPAKAGDPRDACRLDPWVGKIPWRRKWQLTAVFLSGKSYGWRSLAGCNPWGPEESGTTERLSTHTYTPNSLNWFGILDLWVLAKNQKMSGSAVPPFATRDQLDSSFAYVRAGLHQCFPGFRMRQVNEMVWPQPERMWTHRAGMHQGWDFRIWFVLFLW